MRLQAAILDGPNGKFAVLRANPDQGEMPVSTEERQAVARCFKQRHNNIPVAFLANEPAGLRLLSYEDMTTELERCMRDVMHSSDTRWQEFDA